MNTSTQTVENLETDQSGLLGFLGIGVTDNKTTQVTVTNTSSQTNTSTNTVSAGQVTLNAGADEYYQVEAYYDTVFGSVLVREVTPPSPPPAVKAAVIQPLIGLQTGVLLAGATSRTSLVTSAKPAPAPATARDVSACTAAHPPHVRRFGPGPNTCNPAASAGKPGCPLKLFQRTFGMSVSRSQGYLVDEALMDRGPPSQ